MGEGQTFTHAPQFEHGDPDAGVHEQPLIDLQKDPTGHVGSPASNFQPQQSNTGPQPYPGGHQ